MSEYTFVECFERLDSLIEEIDEGYWEDAKEKANETYDSYKDYGLQRGRKGFWVKCVRVMEATFMEVMEHLERDRLGNNNGLFEAIGELNEVFISIVNPEFEDDADGYMEALDALESAVQSVQSSF